MKVKPTSFERWETRLAHLWLFLDPNAKMIRELKEELEMLRSKWSSLASRKDFSLGAHHF